MSPDHFSHDGRVGTFDEQTHLGLCSGIAQQDAADRGSTQLQRLGPVHGLTSSGHGPSRERAEIHGELRVGSSHSRVRTTVVPAFHGAQDLQRRDQTVPGGAVFRKIRWPLCSRRGYSLRTA